MGPNRKKIVLLDLDGTLLSASWLFPLVCIFFLWRRLAPLFGYARALKIGRELMTRMTSNSPASGLTNYELILSEATRLAGVSPHELHKQLSIYYERDFPRLGRFTYPTPGAARALRSMREAGLPLVIATNPIWPLSCVEHRLRWAGLEPREFAFITHSQIMRSCKPSLEYYRECLNYLAAKPDDVLFFGNDERKDGPARELGIETIILDSKGWRAETLPAWMTAR
ncbi:MAG TPA: HAD family hydrolase, partial [Bdellovibrionales bacterium]|nr:HAD family hydrolase [Bdellovibrionales bacterium]